jgi:hypothetical protein
MIADNAAIQRFSLILNLLVCELVVAKRGAPRKPDYLRKELISVKLPRWLIDRLDLEDESRAVLIEQALVKVHKWKARPVYKQVDIADFNE